MSVVCAAIFLQLSGLLDQRLYMSKNSCLLPLYICTKHLHTVQALRCRQSIGVSVMCSYTVSVRTNSTHNLVYIYLHTQSCVYLRPLQMLPQFSPHKMSCIFTHLASYCKSTEVCIFLSNDLLHTIPSCVYSTPLQVLPQFSPHAPHTNYTMSCIFYSPCLILQVN